MKKLFILFFLLITGCSFFSGNKNEEENKSVEDKPSKIEVPISKKNKVPDFYLLSDENISLINFKNYTKNYKILKQFNDKLFSSSHDTIYPFYCQKKDSILLLHFKAEVDSFLYNYIQVINLRDSVLIDCLKFNEGSYKDNINKFKLGILSYFGKKEKFDFRISYYNCTKRNKKGFLHPYYNRNSFMYFSDYLFSESGLVKMINEKDTKD